MFEIGVFFALIACLSSGCKRPWLLYGAAEGRGSCTGQQRAVVLNEATEGRGSCTGQQRAVAPVLGNGGL